MDTETTFWLSLWQWLTHPGWETVTVGVGLFLITFVGSLAVVTWVLLRVPATYFLPHHPPALVARHPIVRWLARIGKNLLGAVLVILGIIMSLPGVPGQGILTILLGVMLLEFPGKRTLEVRLVSRPAVLASINRLRARYGRPPLLVETERPLPED